MIDVLLDAGAGINLTNRSGYTPLHHAAEYGAAEAAARLIERGADVDAKTRRGITPDQVAASRGHEEVAKVIRNAMSSEK